MDAWRAQWGKPTVGRAKLIARLEAVTADDTAKDEPVGGEAGADGEAEGVALRADDGITVPSAPDAAAEPVVKDEASANAADDDEPMLVAADEV